MNTPPAKKKSPWLWIIPVGCGVIVFITVILGLIAWGVYSFLCAPAHPDDSDLSDQTIIELTDEPVDEETEIIDRNVPEPQVATVIEQSTPTPAADKPKDNDKKGSDKKKDADYDKTATLTVIEIVPDDDTKPSAPAPDDNCVFESVEQMPQFPGGEAALMKFLANNIRYPERAQENNIQGRVVVRFVITKTGSISDVRVVRSKDKDLDKEAIRVVKSLPKFTPGKNNGQPVNVWYTLPINFKLQDV